MKLHRLLLTTSIAGALSAIALSAFAASISTQDFVRNASIANEFEIQTSNLALDKSQNREVKQFAQRMIDDHTKTGDKMKEALRASKIDAKPADVLDGKHQKLFDELQAASGDAFNHRYIAIQTNAHKEAVGLFTDYSKNGDDATLKDFATQTLPALKEHLSHVKGIDL